MLKIPANIVIFRYWLILTIFHFALLMPVLVFGQYEAGSLYSAARSGNMQTVKSFLMDDIPLADLNNALGAAVVGNQTRIMKLLIKKGAEVNHLSSWDTPLLINAIMHERFEPARTLIEYGADVDVRGYQQQIHNMLISWNWTPLMCAAYKGNLELVKILLKNGAKINDSGWSNSQDDVETATDIAAYSGHLNVLEYLFKKGGKLNKETIFKTVRAGHLNTFQFLITEDHYNFETPSALTEKTVLMEASWWGHKDIVEFLLEINANVNTIGPNGHTALSEAVSNANEDFPHQYDIAKLLISKGAEVNLAAPFRMTPLMRAMETENNKIIELLIQSGAK